MKRSKVKLNDPIEKQTRLNDKDLQTQKNVYKAAGNICMQTVLRRKNSKGKKVSLTHIF